MSDGLVLDGQLTWSGEHWIDYLRVPGEDSDSGMVSIFNIRYCEAGSGITAWVDIKGGPTALKGIFTDNAEVTDFLLNKVAIDWNHPPYGQDLTVAEAEFSQSGHIAVDPSWTLASSNHEVVATWTQLQPVVVAHGAWPPGPSGNFCFSLLHFAEGASLSLDGVAIAGQPYVRDIWRKTIGGDRSSCVFALAESFLRV